MKRLFPFVFILMLALEIYFSSFGNSLGVYFTKPFLMPILMIFYGRYSSKINLNVIFALAFSLSGDVLLMLPGSKWFIPGLVSFLVAHLFYTKIFFKQSRLFGAKAFFLILITMAYFTFIKSHLPNDLLGAVLAYCLVISFMGAVAVERPLYLDSYKLVAMGALLFIFSDACIAYSKFVRPFEGSTLAIMSTYGMAQLSLVLGIMKAEN
jgi:alkylglycerol monooxygenase